MEKFDSNIPVRCGLILFVAVLVIGLMMYVFYQALASSFVLMGIIGLFSMGLALFVGIWSGITYRREHGGVISFAHAFLAVYIVFVFYSVGTICSSLLVNKVVDPNYAHKISSLMQEKMSEQFEKMNLDDDKIKEALSNMGPEKFDPPFSKLMQTLGIWLGVLGVISVIVALFIKRGSADLMVTEPPAPIRPI